MHQDLNHLSFGVEFEVVLPPRVDHASAAARIARITGLEITTGSRVAPTRATATAWKVVHDGSVQSLRGEGIGAEFVSPVLKGQNGIDQVRAIAAAFGTIGATVNQTCGFHVHVGGFAPEIGFFQSLVKLYSRFEPVIDRLMPASRRASANPYCRSLATVNPAFIDSARSLDAVIQAQTGLPTGNYSRRYQKLNLEAYNKHRTVEFRQHAGTTDGEKAVAWAMTCLRMVRAAQLGKTGVTRAANGAVSFEHLPAKARKTAEMITRPTGATAQEILEGSDWPVLSVNRQARIAGLSVRVVRERGKDRFFAEVGTAQVEVNLTGFVELLESGDEERVFLTRRAEELQSSGAAQ